jgi:hypothetical protein
MFGGEQKNERENYDFYGAHFIPVNLNKKGDL